MRTLLLDTLQNILLPLLLNIGFAGAGVIWLYHIPPFLQPQYRKSTQHGGQ